MPRKKADQEKSGGAKGRPRRKLSPPAARANQPGAKKPRRNKKLEAAEAEAQALRDQLKELDLDRHQTLNGDPRSRQVTNSVCNFGQNFRDLIGSSYSAPTGLNGDDLSRFGFTEMMAHIARHSSRPALGELQRSPEDMRDGGGDQFVDYNDRDAAAHEHKHDDPPPSSPPGATPSSGTGGGQGGYKKGQRQRQNGGAGGGGDLEEDEDDEDEDNLF